MSILLVDDDPDSLASTSKIVAGCGQNLCTARSSRDALRLLETTDFAVIILDVCMPGDLSGFELARLIRSRERSATTPIIFISGLMTDETLVNEGYLVGAVDYLLKPIRPEMLQAKVRVFVDLARTAALRESEARLRVQATSLEQVIVGLQRAAETKSEFNASVTHDLRTPLTTILQGIQLVEDGTLGPLNDEQRRFLVLARDDVMRLADLVGTLITSAQLDRGQLPVRKLRVSVAAVVERVLGGNRSYARELGISLLSELPPEPPQAFCDPDHYYRILANLVSNALKCTMRGGSVRIHLSDGGDGTVVTRVSDTGVGIPADQLYRVFRRYEQVQRSSEKMPAGTGLGLAICRELVELNGGTIGFESTENVGSTFFFTVPVYRDGTAATQPAGESMTVG